VRWLALLCVAALAALACGGVGVPVGSDCEGGAGGEAGAGGSAGAAGSECE
jgi:hypothetical protein